MSRQMPVTGEKTLYLIIVLSWAVISHTGCGIKTGGSISFTDPAYEVKVVGTNNDGFDVPDGLFWKNGKLYMADEGGSAFRIWTSASDVKTLSKSSDGIMSPEDFVIDLDENIFFTDDDAGGVWKIDKNGKTVLLAGKEKGLVSTEGIALTVSGDILVGDGKSHKIFRVTQNGDVSVFLNSGITKPESMAFTESGELYVADNEDHILYLLSPEKKLKRVIADRPGFSPESIWYSDGVLFITDSDHGILRTYDPVRGLQTIAVFTGVLAKVSGITTDDAGAIFVSIQTHIDRKLGYILRLVRVDSETAKGNRGMVKTWDLEKNQYQLLERQVN